MPLARLRIITNDLDAKNLTERSYTRRYLNTFPKFLSLSETNRKILVVNASCINNSLYFIDPVSLSILNQVFLRIEDYKMSSNLARTLSLISPGLLKLQMSKYGKFDEVFKEKMVYLDEKPCVSRGNFHEFLCENFENVEGILERDLLELIDFIDQKSNEYISKTEFEFLFEAGKLAQNKKKSENRMMAKLAGLSDPSYRILKKMYDFFVKSKLSIEDAFKIFDGEEKYII